MNQQSLTASETHKPHSRRESVYLVLVFLPIALFLLLLFGGWLHERAATSIVDDRLATLVSEGMPIDDISLARVYDQRTDRSHAGDWQDVSRSISALASKYRLLYQTSDYDAVLPPSESWQSEALVTASIEEAQPIIETIKSLADTDGPTWHPVLFENVRTRLPDLQESRSIIRLLRAQFAVAYHKDDHVRAIETLRLMLAAAKSLDAQAFSINDLVYFSLISQHRLAIRQSLAHDYWTSEELDELRNQVGAADDLDERWKRMVAADRTAGLAMTNAIEDDQIGRSELPEFISFFKLSRFASSHRLSLLNRFDEYLPKGKVGTEEYSDIIFKKNEGHRHFASSQFSITAIPFATPDWQLDYFVLGSVESFYESLIRYDIERRWVVCAIAVKQFQLQHGRWPNELSELSQVGLSPSDWLVIDSHPFFYEVADDGDGVSLYNWAAIGLRDSRSASDWQQNVIAEYKERGRSERIETRIR